MHRATPLLLLLGACETDGDLYGGGEGLTLAFGTGDPATMHWAGATKAELRDVNGGIFDEETTWDPVTLGALRPDAWTVRVDDDFDANEYLDALGFDCPIGPSVFTAFADVEKAGFLASFEVDREDRWVQVVGAFQGDTPGLFDFEDTLEAQWSGDLDACPHGALPTTFDVSWTLDEDVRVPNQCLECNLPSFEIPGDFDPQF